MAQHAGDDSTQAHLARRAANGVIRLCDAVSRRCARLSQSRPRRALAGWYHESMVRLTERAAEHVLALMREDPEALALRVAVQGGGCSGLQYALGFDGEPTRRRGGRSARREGRRRSVQPPVPERRRGHFVDGLMGAGYGHQPERRRVPRLRLELQGRGRRRRWWPRAAVAPAPRSRPALRAQPGRTFTPWWGRLGSHAVEGDLQLAQPVAEPEVEMVVAASRSSRAARSGPGGSRR